MNRPLIGITVNNQQHAATSGQYESAIAYSRAVALAGGVPVLLPHEPEMAGRYLHLCDGIVLTGGADAAMEMFGQVTHPQSKLMDPRRQAFEVALLKAAAEQLDKPVLGICLGMQLMALHAGGKLNQHLPETLGEAAAIHQSNSRHAIELRHAESAAFGWSRGLGHVVSSHRQAVADAGSLCVIAAALDGVVEAVADFSRPFYLGVQWHPERGGDSDCPLLNRGIFQRLVQAAARAKAPAA